jgi:RHS repeat-associated protein
VNQPSVKPNPGNWRSSYGYDAADNITQVSSQTNTASNWSATPNALNQIATRNSTSWVYDAAGNLLDDGARTYTWDAAQRLISITDKATGRKSEFIYDGQSRLTITKEYPAGSATSQETRYLWCGHKVCQARDGQDNITARYFDEGEIKGSQSLYYTKDHQGSIMETTQASGKVLGSLDYGPYGEAEKAQGQLPDFRYAGMLHHAPTGLYLTHYRAYDPTVGRWLNRDPIGEDGGINLYGYVGGNPVSRIDPLGLYDSSTPWTVGWEWLTGTGEKHRDFTNGDPFAEMLKKHSNIQRLVKRACAGTVPSQGKWDYSVGGWDGLFLYLNDYSTLLTGGATGNLAVTYLGSYKASYAITNGTLHIMVTNSSTIQSATHPPIIGYTKWWGKHIGNPLDEMFKNGPMSKTTQKFDISFDLNDGCACR